jgi:hypothetical protein
VSIDTDFDGEKCFPRIEAARRTVSGQERADADTAGIFQRATKRCDMGVGCDEAGVCYAESHGEPNRCPKAEIVRFNIYGNLINPDPNGMYVRYEDHARALFAAGASERADAEKDAALTEARKFVAGYTHDNNLWIDSALALLERIDAILAAKEKK